MARDYRHGRPTVGVLAGWQFYWTATPLSYLSPVYRGIRLAAAELGCNVLLGCGMGASATAGDLLRPAWPVPSSESDFVPIGPWNTDGLIAVNPMHSQTRSDYLQGVMATGHPVVFVGSGERGPTILADNAGGILQAMRHLVEHGHRRIAFVAGSPEDMTGDTGERLRAYQSALGTFGLAEDPRLVAFGRHVSSSGYAALQQILSSSVPFTAVLASNDESALGAIQALKEAGRHVPDDIAVIGFDDRLESSVQEPALTSVQVPLFKMGYRAVEVLLQQLEAPTKHAQQIKVATRLVIRESCGCGRSAVLADALNATTPQTWTLDPDARYSRLVQTMAASVLAEAQGLSAAEVYALCERLVETFVVSVAQNDPTRVQRVLDDILCQAVAGRDDAHLWQAAISVLRSELPTLAATWSQPSAEGVGREVLHQARITISAAMRQQHRQYLVDQHWTGDRLGRLTASLQTALDEPQIYEALAQHLPEMGIDTAWVALFEPEGDDPVAWSLLRAVTAPQQATVRSRDFPPEGWIADDQPFSLALLPLVGRLGKSGFVAFDTSHLEVIGAIAQQLVAALNTAQLYREATEGRRLAEEANQMKSRFLSTVSHELRTPLNLIVGLSGLLLRESEEGGAPAPEPYRADVERIHANAQHLGGLIGDVLDLASSEAGQLRLTKEFVDLGKALGMVAETGRQLAQNKGLAWHATLPDSGPWVWGDRTRLRQVILNLVSNAVKFTARGAVSLSLEANGGSVTVTVRDTGLGIPPGEQQAIFDEFRRSERSITRGYGGLGLGLAICKRLAELHGGAIDVYSTGEEGAGSTFTFSLPTVPSPAVQEPEPAAARLVEPAILVLTPLLVGGQRLLEYLTGRGFQVQVARVEDSQSWLAQLLAAPPSAVVLDIGQASEHGWHALKTIKGNPATQDIPVLFYVGSKDSGAVLELDYLTKPIELAELTRALDQHWLAAADRPARTFLVVDDDPDTLEMHARIVQAHSSSNQVLRARNGREALEIMQRMAVDLVLLDLMMPELDGFGVLQAMRERESMRDIPVIVVTGRVLTESEMARLNTGVATVLGKGLFGLDETLAHLEAALERRRRLSGEAQRLVRKAMAYLHEHYSYPISRQELARHVGMNEHYLTTCFRQELGMTPVAYLNRFRIMQAKHLLADTDQSITEIALDVGFSDSGYFSRVFRREVGMSPEAYRRM